MPARGGRDLFHVCVSPFKCKLLLKRERGKVEKALGGTRPPSASQQRSDGQAKASKEGGWGGARVGLGREGRRTYSLWSSGPTTHNHISFFDPHCLRTQ